MQQKGADGVVQRAEHTFGLAVLWRGVRAGEAKMNATCGQVGCGGIIHELRAVVSLKALND
jgi:hypothetical protein